MRSVLSFALGAAAGAAAAHFLDPDSGRRRRHVARDQAASKAASAASAVQTQAQYTAGQVKGAAHGVVPHRHEPMDDMTLSDRVRSEIFRDHDAPKGSVSVDVQGGVAYLRGEVADQAWIDRLGSATRQVEGITGVKNLLHAPGTPTPAAEPRFLASQHFRS
ncbi:MAG TPA: BON domain-containing protein [Solirubrobacter sp.]|jgi:osmotically-inducible protein OsmY|nr:BON domain-containing protein [Solirubrobacter sp.]